MASCFPFFNSKKHRKDKKAQHAQEIDDITEEPRATIANPPTGTPTVNLEAEKLQEQLENQEKQEQETKPANEQTSDLPNYQSLPPTSNQSAPEEQEVTTHVHTHEVITIKEYIPQNETPTEKELAAQLEAAQAKLKLAELQLQNVQNENVKLLEKSVDYANLKKKKEDQEKEIDALKKEKSKLNDQIEKSKKEIINYQNHINSAGKFYNRMKLKINNIFVKFSYINDKNY